MHTAHRLEAAEALLSDQRLEGRFEAVDGEYLAACRQRDRRELEEREDQLRRIAEQQAARAVLQRSVTWGLSTAAVVVLGLLVWIVMQTSQVSLRTSLILTAAAEAAADQKRFDRSLRLGVLAARATWLRPAHATAPPVLSRAADVSTLRTPFDHTGAVKSASFSSDSKRVVTTSQDKTARVWDAFWPSLVEPKNLIEEVCQRKLRGNVRHITEADVRAARILSHDRVGEDVCAGVAAVPAR